MKRGLDVVPVIVRKHPGRFVFAVLAIVALIHYLELFSPRYGGLTIHQWIAHNAEEQALPRREVVQHFGLSAVPALLRDSKPGGLYSFSIAAETLFRRMRFDQLRSADFDRRLACADWAQMLLVVQPDAFTTLLTMTHQDAEAGLEITRLFYGERYLRETLRALQLQNTNLTLQVRAGELLEKYRDTI